MAIKPGRKTSALSVDDAADRIKIEFSLDELVREIDISRTSGAIANCGGCDACSASASGRADQSPGAERVTVEFRIDDVISQKMRTADVRANCGGCDACSADMAFGKKADSQGIATLEFKVEQLARELKAAMSGPAPNCGGCDACSANVEGRHVAAVDPQQRISVEFKVDDIIRQLDQNIIGNAPNCSGCDACSAQ